MVVCRRWSSSSIPMPLLLSILLLLFIMSTEAESLVKYKDPKQPLNVRIKDLMSRMTLEEKIGQMVQIERSVATPQVMKKYFIGKFYTLTPTLCISLDYVYIIECL